MRKFETMPYKIFLLIKLWICFMFFVSSFGCMNNMSLNYASTLTCSFFVFSFKTIAYNCRFFLLQDVHKLSQLFLLMHSVIKDLIHFIASNDFVIFKLLKEKNKYFVSLRGSLYYKQHAISIKVSKYDFAVDYCN